MPRVSVAYVHPDELSANFHQSFVGMLMYDGGSHGYLMHPDGHIEIRCGTDGLVAARNDAVREFLSGSGEWLFWIDSDMGFAPSALDELMAAADPKERPIIGGLCMVSKAVGSDGIGGYRTAARPTIFRWTDHEGVKAFRGVSYYPVNRVMRCDATGSAFVVIHRSVLEAIRERFGEVWYERTRGSDDSLLGEDISFCVRAGALGFSIHVHTGVRTNHHKPQWVAELDFWERYQAPPATVPTAVLVPVMKRPQNAKPFMESLRASTGLATVYAIARDGDADTMAAWKEAGAGVISSSRSRFGEKVNLGFRQTTEPFVFLVGDDVRFRPGWLDHAQHVAAVEGAAVVGTNDLANPRVMAGTHATHLLVARAYVERDGASWDGAGIVCHEGYRHWYVDDEIVTAAKQRGVWAMALGSIVEHLHPIFGRAETDEVYELGQLGAAEDAKTFKARSRRHQLEAARAS